MRALPLLLLVLPLAACGGGASNRLFGSVTQTYNLAFDKVEVYKQMYQGEFKALKVSYIHRPGTAGQRYPAIVIVNSPVAQGQDKDLVADGSLSRAWDDASEFPKMKTGKITFEELSDVGQTASGKFYITFQADPLKGMSTEGTLNGEFSATLQQL